jgi:tetratricopeptide (TPR) repeat protein
MIGLIGVSALALATMDPGHSHEHVPQLGTVTFKTTCTPIAQELFKQGLGWLHSFEYRRAQETFDRAAITDPGCGIADWGVAMSYYHPLWDAPTRRELENGNTAIEKPKAAGAKTQREKDYTAAFAIFYRDFERVNLKTRALAYSEAMQQLYKRYPNDDEAAVFYALSLIAAGTMDGDHAFPRQKKAGAILNQVLAKNPAHPGVAHYLIHSFDYPVLAELALPAARRYASIAPDSAHAQHMPSHIFTRLGLWDEAIRSNRAAEASAIRYAKSSGMPGAWDQQLHAMDYLAYAYLQSGREADAEKVLEELKTIRQAEPPSRTVAYAVTAIPARLALEGRHWREAASLQLPANLARLPALAKQRWALAHIHFARAVGSARSGGMDRARAEVANLGALEKSLVVQPGEYDWRQQISIERQIAAAWIALARGEKDEAVRLMRAAADLDDATEKNPVTPGPILPAREQLGELLLTLGQPTEALIEYENSLKRAPKRLAGLAGAAQAAKLAGNKEKATRYFAALAEIPNRSVAARLLRELAVQH